MNKKTSSTTRFWGKKKKCDNRELYFIKGKIILLLMHGKYFRANWQFVDEYKFLIYLL